MCAEGTTFDWQQCLPDIQAVVPRDAPSCMADIISTVGDVGSPAPDGHCGYVGALAGLILLSAERPNGPMVFRKMMHDFAGHHAEELLSLPSYREVVTVYSGCMSTSSMAIWVQQTLLPSIWNPSLASSGVPLNCWFNFELDAPILVLKYNVSLILFSGGRAATSKLTVVCRATMRGDVRDVSFDTFNGFVTEAAMLPRTVVLVLFDEHFYVVRPGTHFQNVQSKSGRAPRGDSREGSTLSGFESDPRRALMLWYSNSDIRAFDPIDFMPAESAVRQIKEEALAEIPTTQEASDMLSEYYSSRGCDYYASDGLLDRGPLLLSCGVCGQREYQTPEQSYVSLSLEQLHCLKVCDAIEIDDLRRTFMKM